MCLLMDFFKLSETECSHKRVFNKYRSRFLDGRMNTSNISFSLYPPRDHNIFFSYGKCCKRYSDRIKDLEVPLSFLKEKKKTPVTASERRD